MDYEAAKFWLEAVMMMVNIALWIFVWNSNKNRVTNEKIAGLEQEIESKLEDHAEKLGRMDERLKVSIGHPELKPVYDRMNGMQKELSEINGKMHTLDLIHEMLLKGDK